MKRMLIAWAGLACLACVERPAPMSAILPTVEDTCVGWCELAEVCWADEVLPNPYAGDVVACIDECLDLDAAWANDPWGRSECPTLVQEYRLCFVSYEMCEAFEDAQIDGRWGPEARCADEGQVASMADCWGPDPRSDP